MHRQWKRAQRDSLRWYRHLRYHQVMAGLLLVLFASTTEPLACLLHCHYHPQFAPKHDSALQHDHLHTEHATEDRPMLEPSLRRQTPRIVSVGMSDETGAFQVRDLQAHALCHHGLDSPPGTGSSVSIAAPEHEHRATLAMLPPMAKPLPERQHVYEVHAALPLVGLPLPLRPPIL
jgi:hypothetical protein